MFRTLQSRLWLTYAILIFAILSILAVGIFVYVVRFPGIDRQALQKLEVISRLVQRLYDQGTFPSPFNQRRIENFGEQFSSRILIFGEGGDKIFDSNPGQAELRWSRGQREVPSRGMIRDLTDQTWLYTAKRLSSDHIMLITTPRQGGVSLLRKPRFREVLRGDFLPPFIRAGAVALVLALLLAFWMTRWISKPIADVTVAARNVADGEYHQIHPQGPQEVRSLTSAFNEMVRKVKSSQQSQRDFVANVSHELKTPLTSIQGFAQAMLDGTVENLEEMKKSAQVIQSEAERMDRLVLDLLELARYDAGTIELDARALNLENLLSQVVDQMRMQAESAGVEVVLDLNPLPGYTGDPDRLSQVFMNLVDNGIKYSPPGGRVEIHGKLERDQVVISVKDTGVGIPEEDIPRVFDRFYQVDKSRSYDREPGSGLGLAIAQEIVHTHGGQIGVRSERGKGSHFYVRLPLGCDGKG